MADKQEPQEDSSFIELAMTRFRQAADAESAWRALSLDDLRFSTGEQWPLTVRTQRERDNRPCLTMDLTQQAVRIVCNEFRQQRPSIEVNPVGSESDVDTAEILQGIVRHIEVNSDAEIAYDMAHEQVVRTGIGHWRILNDYVDDGSDEQEVFLKPIRNQFTVYWQPGAPSYQEAGWAFIIEDVPRSEYQHGDYKDSKLAKVASLNDFSGIGNPSPEWFTKDTIRTAEYFELRSVKGSRARSRKEVWWTKINAVEKIEPSTKLPGKSIPILTVVGDDIDVDGKRYLAGLIRNAKDPQRMTNYWYSRATETGALASTAPWIMVEGQNEGHENEWAEANIRNLSVLTYKQVDVQGKPAPPPQRNSIEPPIQAMVQMLTQSSMGVKSAMGIYDPSLGQRKGDESGSAIEKLQQQGSLTTLNFSDNSSRTMRRGGKLLLEWIREIYDTPRVQRIIKPDGTVQQVVTHVGPEQAAAANKLLTDKITKIYDIGVGRYDVTISVGPSYQTKRQEAVSTQLELVKASPELFPLIGDILVGNMDIPGSKEIAGRLKKMLPPQLQDEDGTPEAKLAQAQAQLQQLGTQNKLLAQHVNEMSETIKTKQVETQGKVQIAQFQSNADLAIKKLDSETKIAIAQITTKSQEAQTRDQETNDVWAEIHGSAHETAENEKQRTHEQDMAAQQAQAAQESQQSDQGHDLTMATVSAQNGDEENG